MTAPKPPIDDALLAALAGLVPDARPAPEAADALRARILAQAGAARMRVVRADEGQWAPFVPGIHIKTLRRDEAQGTQTSLWRLQPGAVVPPHPHHHEEECLVLEGSVVQEGVEYRAGDYLLAPVGEMHAPFTTPQGALLLIRSELIPDAEALRRFAAATPRP
jgi:quercetin dioxygenase-like cupin family protein